MATERSPLLPTRPTLGRPLDTTASTPADGSDAGDVSTLTTGNGKGKSRDRFYEENEEISRCNVFMSVHRVYRQIQEYIDLPLTDEQLKSPELQLNIIAPLELFLSSIHEPSIVYVLLLVRLQYLRDGASALASNSLNETRATVCEMLAIKLLRHQATTAKGTQMGLLAMARALVGGFHAFQGASEEVLDRIRSKEGYGSRLGALSGAGKTNALELAILGKARMFIKSQTTQKVIGAIYEGRITYSSSSFIDILPDRWKSKEIALYNVREAPLLDHYRLRVPKYRSVIEFGSFLLLFGSFILVILDRHTRFDGPSAPSPTSISWQETWFFVYALGYSLDKLASIAEHGWSVYAAGLTNGLDAASLPIYVAAFVMRMHSVVRSDAEMSDRAYAILSCAACLLFPRLAFTVISNNLLILSLRAMLADFVYLLGVTVFCFIGFVFALNHLSEGVYSVPRISEWLVFIFFGLDGSGIDESPKFDPVLGPILFISFAALSNTLLTSVLVAILSTTYANVAADAGAEDMFRKAVATFEGVKSNSLFDYVPPLNIIALCIMWPLSHFLSPRWFHKVNVFATRTLSLPILLFIAFYERQLTSDALIVDWLTRAKVALTGRLPSAWAQKLSLLEGAHWECEAVFEYTPSGDEADSTSDEFDDSSTYGGDDEVEELAIEYPGAGANSSAAGGGADGTQRFLAGARASAVLDPVRIAAAQQQMQRDAQSGFIGAAGGGSGAGGTGTGTTSSTSSSLLTPSTPFAAAPGTAHTAPPTPIPLSRQPSFAHGAEGSTIRPPRATSRPPLPRPPSAPASATAPQSPPRHASSSSTTPGGGAFSPVFSDSPPSSPQPARTIRPDAPSASTRFAPLPSTSSRAGAGATGLRRSQTVSERLPANASASGSGGHRRRRSSFGVTGGEALDWPLSSSFSLGGLGGAGELSSSAPVKDSPLARLYSHQGLSDEPLHLDQSGGVGGRAGAVRRRMSLGPASAVAGHARFGSEGGAGGAGTGGGVFSPASSAGVAAGARRYVAGGGASEPGVRELVRVIEGLVETVARLERRLEEREGGE
ncbi:hypothetical protein JCM10207_002377 [Rhodosporidiobolus poonsookiae]